MNTRGLILGIAVSAALAGCGDSTTGNGGSTAGCGTKATDSCTPHVSADSAVRVDTLKWRLKDIYKTREFGPLIPHGVYIVAVLKVFNGKNDAVTLTDDVVKLSNGSQSFPQDMAAEGAMDNGDVPGNASSVTQLNAGESTSITAVFDVPRSVLHAHPELQFNELGFGSTHGYIDVPLPLG